MTVRCKQSLANVKWCSLSWVQWGFYTYSKKEISPVSYEIIFSTKNVAFISKKASCHIIPEAFQLRYLVVSCRIWLWRGWSSLRKCRTALRYASIQYISACCTWIKIKIYQFSNLELFRLRTHPWKLNVKCIQSSECILWCISWWD